MIITNKERKEKKEELHNLLGEMNSYVKELMGRKDEKELAKDDLFLSLLQQRQIIKIELCRYDLHEFVKSAWKIVTATEYVEQWYLRIICEHLEMLYDCEFLKIIISISPRSGKSTILSQIFPVWLWLQDITTKILTVSYGSVLSGRDASRSRDLINHPFFQTHWGELFEWAGDQNAKHYYRNTSGGERIGTSPGGMGTGTGAHYLCMDDINKASDAGSTKKLREAVDYYEGTLISRYIDPTKYRQVCLQQRISIDDLSGILQREHRGWEVLCLPEEYTGIKNIGFGFKDPRTEIGELLKPGLLPRKQVDEIKSTNLFTWESQYQQNPVPPGGAYVKEEDLRWWANHGKLARPTLEDFNNLFLSADLGDGSTESNSSYTCVLLLGVIGLKIYVLDVVYKKLTFPEQVTTFLNLRKSYKNISFSLVEEHSNGRALCDYLEKEHLFENLVRIDTRKYGGDKVSRFFATLPNFVANNIYLPDNNASSFSGMMRSQLLAFPKCTDKDFVDALTQAINYWNKHREEIKNKSFESNCSLDVKDFMPNVNYSSEVSLSDVLSLYEFDASSDEPFFDLV